MGIIFLINLYFCILKAPCTQIEIDSSAHDKYFYFRIPYHFLRYVLESAPRAIDFIASSSIDYFTSDENTSDSVSDIQTCERLPKQWRMSYC